MAITFFESNASINSGLSALLVLGAGFTNQDFREIRIPIRYHEF